MTTIPLAHALRVDVRYRFEIKGVLDKSSVTVHHCLSEEISDDVADGAVACTS